MTNTNMRKGFTMIELIFVIVIIGILAAVAIPKLAANRDDATASTCLHEIGQLQSEISQAYAASADFASWADASNTIDQVSNITYSVTDGNGLSTGNLQVHNQTHTYMCDSVDIATIAPNTSGTDYIMTVVATIPEAGSSPAAIKAATELTAKQNGATKVYTF